MLDKRYFHTYLQRQVSFQQIKNLTYIYINGY